jgi:hypothetical protein
MSLRARRRPRCKKRNEPKLNILLTYCPRTTIQDITIPDIKKFIGILNFGDIIAPK